MTSLPLDLYVAGYDAAPAADLDWGILKNEVRRKRVEVEAIVLLQRDAAGELDVRDTGHGKGKGAVAGGLAGALLGVIFPQALLASAIFGAGLGAGAGAVVDKVSREELAENLGDLVPPGGAAIVVVVGDRWVEAVERTLSRAVRFEHHGGAPTVVDEPVSEVEAAEDGSAPK